MATLNFSVIDKITHGFGINGRSLASEAMSLHPNAFKCDRQGFGLRTDIIVASDGIGIAEPIEVGGSSRLAFAFSDKKLDEVLGRLDVNFRVEIPIALLKAKRDVTYTLYNIRFDYDCDKRFFYTIDGLLAHGYIGITKRHFMQRFKEHQHKARYGGGHILHSVWRELLTSNVSFLPVVQICAFSGDLAGIYALEEEAVAKHTLTPKGLNAIPGGYAGIRMLHELALLGNRAVVHPEERDLAIERLAQGKGGRICLHYRSGHIRTLADSRRIWVSPCWVNLPKQEVA